MADANKVIKVLTASIADLTLQVAILKVELEEQQDKTASEMGLVPIDAVESE